MRSKKIVLSGLVALAGIAAILVFLPRPPEYGSQPSGGPVRTSDATVSPRQLPATDTAPSMSNAAPASPSVRASSVMLPVPLPPQNTKVKDVIAQLKADAEKGVPQAACRLGAELTRCWQAQQKMAIRDSTLSRLGTLPPKSPEAVAISTRASEILAQVGADRDLCEGVGADDVKDAWRYLLKAALGGNAAAMAQFAVAPPLSSEDVVGSLEGWSAYQQYSADFLRRSIQNGDVRSLYMAYFSAATGLGPGGQAVNGRNPYQALVYGQALIPLVDPATAQQIQAFLPQARAEVPTSALQADQEARELRDKFFGGKPRIDVSAKVGAVAPADCGQ